MLRREASRTRSVGRSVCRSVFKTKLAAGLPACMLTKSKIVITMCVVQCGGVWFILQIIILPPSLDQLGLGQWEYITTVNPLSYRGAKARIAGFTTTVRITKYQGCQAIQYLHAVLVPTLAKCSPFTLKQCFPRLVGPRGNTHGRFIQSDRTGLNQSDRTGIGQLLPGPRTKNNWQRLKGKLLDLRFAHGESSISCLEWAGIK